MYPSKVGRVKVCALAELKRLPAAEFDAWGVSNQPDGVGIQYYDMCGIEAAVKSRTALAAKDGSYWPAGVPLMAYGEWRIDVARSSSSSRANPIAG